MAGKKTGFLKFEHEVEFTESGRQYFNQNFGVDIWNVSGNQGFSSMGRWKTLAIKDYKYDDGSSELVYVMLNENNEIVEKTVHHFRVVDI